MKNSKIKYILLTFALILICSLFFFLKSETAKAGYEHNVWQWVWSQNIGWFSLNNINACPEPTCEDYGVNATDGKIWGWAWSQYTGYICFGKTCKEVDWDGDGNTCSTPSPNTDDDCKPPDSSELEIIYETPPPPNNISKVTQGWARIMNLGQYGNQEFGQNDWGWIHLSNIPTYWVQVNTVTAQLQGWAWSGNGSDALGNEVEGSGYGWIAFTFRLPTPATIEGKVTDFYTEEPIEGAIVFTDKGGFTTTTESDGSYELPVIRDDYFVNAVATGYAKKGRRVCKEPDPCPVEEFFTADDGTVSGVDLGLETAVVGDKTISGVVYEDLNGNEIYDSGEEISPSPPDVYVIVWTDHGGYSTLDVGRDCDGNLVPGAYCLKDVVADYYKVYASATGYSQNWQPGDVRENNATNVNIPLSKTGPGPTKATSWIHTWWSDVHSNKIIEGSVSPNTALYGNATYIITAEGTIVNFFSWAQGISGDPGEQLKEWVSEYYGALGYTGTPGGVFDPIDIDKLKGEAEEITSSSISASDLVNDDFNVPKVWRYDGDLEITGGEFGAGAKTVIVDGGDLVLNPGSDGIVYESNTFSDQQLPSVGFIVRNGNVKIQSTQEDPNDGTGEQENIVGAFYVEGDPLASTPTGIIYTRCPGGICAPPGEPELNRDRHLVCEGLMVARKLEFQRSTSLEPWIAYKGDGTSISSYPEGNAPSEVIWYDSRVVINTPKGFEDFVKALPAWEER